MKKTACICAGMAVLFAVCPSFAEDSGSTGAAQEVLSFNAIDLCGKWSMRGGETRSGRTFEFFPDGRVTEASIYRSSSGETTETYKKLWKIEGDKVLILQNGARESSDQSLFIEIPFDTSHLQIAEVWKSPSSTRVTKMIFDRVEASPSSPASDRIPAAPAVPPTTSLSKLGIAVSPSTKNSTEGYAKVQRLSLNITLKNPSLRESTGPMTVSYWILGKNVSDSKQFCVLSQGKFSCTLGSSATDRELKRATDSYLNKYYDYYSSGNFEYTGWIVTVSDPSGRVALTKASKSEWERQSDKLGSLETEKVYDLRLDKIEGACVPRYY